MAIQMRRGQVADLDKSKLVAGEWVVGTDAGKDYVAIAKSPSHVIDMATKDDLANIVLYNGGVAVEEETLIFGVDQH